MKRYNVPFIIFINKLDRINANPLRALDQLRKKLGLNCAFVYLPIGLEKDFRALIDIIENEIITFEGENGEIVNRDPLPSEYKEIRDEKFEELVGALADADEEIEELFLMEETPTKEQLHGGKYLLDTNVHHCCFCFR